MAGAGVHEFGEANFESEVMKSDKPVLIDFWAEWCPPCRALSPRIDELATRYAGRVKVGKINVDKEQSLAASFQVSAIPMVVVMNQGQVVEVITGLRSVSDYAAVLDGLVAK